MHKFLKYAIFITISILSLNISAQEITKPSEKKDSSNISILNSGKTSINQFQNLYSLESELEHQKLLRNIFAVSFVFLFATLMFIIFYYGSKVKKINELISHQNEYMNSTKDQLQKIIGVFNYIDQYVFITNSKGVIEWTNNFALNDFKEDYENSKLNLLDKFSSENQGKVFQAINKMQATLFNEKIFENDKNWKMIPIANSKNEFSNMVFIATTNLTSLASTPLS